MKKLILLLLPCLLLFVPALTNGQDMAGSKLVAKGAKLQLLAADYSFTEGPAVDARGNVYFTDQPNDRIMKWSTDGSITTYMENAGRANGLYVDHQGNLLACADEKNELWRISPNKDGFCIKSYGRDNSPFNVTVVLENNTKGSFITR